MCQCIYVSSSGDHPEFFDKGIKEALSLDNEMIIINDDWYIALNLKIDTNQLSKVYCAISREKIIEFIHDYDLADIDRTVHSDTRKYSWRRSISAQRSRHDHFLVSELLGLEIVSADMLPGYHSDRLLVCVYFKSGIVKRCCLLGKFSYSLH